MKEKLSAKMGRPKSDNPKSYEVKTRIDELSFKALESYCQENKVSRSEAIRLGIEKLGKKQK